MPEVFRESGFCAFFYSNEHDPMHVHVRKGGAECKVRLRPLGMVRNYGFSEPEQKRILAIVAAHLSEIETYWLKYFGL